jgi:hypothetical protein
MVKKYIYIIFFIQPFADRKISALAANKTSEMQTGLHLWNDEYRKIFKSVK